MPSTTGIPDNVVPVTSTPSSKDAITAGAVAQSNAPAHYTAATTVHSMNDLRKKAPKLYKAMILGIAMNICQEMQHHQDRLKKLMRESREGQ